MTNRCIVCESNCYRPSIFGGYNYKNKNYTLVRCVKCGFMFLNPLPSCEVLDEIYNGYDYFEGYYGNGSRKSEYIAGMWDHSKNDLKTINLINLFKKSGKLLDLGCAGGRFMINARKSGFSVYGIEPNKKMATHAKEKLELEVLCRNIEDVSLEDRRFDIIHAADVLEHLLGLPKTMVTIKNVLEDDGILVISQPLTYNRSFYNLFLGINMLIKKDRYQSQNPPTHLWEFNFATLRKFIENMGFEILYYNISESKSRALSIYKSPTLKNLLGHYSKNISSFLSNNPISKMLKMGDRATVVCKKSIDET
tara:strand:+ start:2568 stop:3491 length:924 start_codon:yes stop_codon:yes gene_type:complete